MTDTLKSPVVLLRFDTGAITARFKDAPLQIVCSEFTTKTRVKIVVADGLADDLVSLAVTLVAPDDALRQLLAGYDTFLFYGGNGNAGSALETVWVYPKGSASGIRPVPRSDWAGVRELEATLDDANAEVREAAYQALLDRPDTHSRNVVIEAIKGVRERDVGVRERLLSTALSKGFPLTAEALTDLARADPSEHVRWMALDALAFSDFPSAKDVAEAATTDPSETVRSRAKEMLAQLNRGRPEARVETDDAPPDPPDK